MCFVQWLRFKPFSIVEVYIILCQPQIMQFFSTSLPMNLYVFSSETFRHIIKGFVEI